MPRRARRFLFFIIAILIGIVVGVVYGWVINPVKYEDTGPHSLRIDYKTDYILMVAELYQSENDIYASIERLVFLGDDPLIEMLNQAILFAGQNNYDAKDIELMWNLLEAVKIVLPQEN